ncbi:hypothetical protein CHRY9390_01057 [Chryseobacterium aquaeductus]|uniref:Uncharacterized protein n=1 Tax=Chryseobacterium aquaeductus TaxID=2675056 RepID=A0A9N8QRV3_9FLAO|nr:hypothetical protein [Chryseobacterium aquaeductus]CAA7330389.1 hypothetical protein CHRY9390_01057 [Chryseobacterium potabilaquae]CAD7803294.1 hypothetical protein CHRY9390_01057 [Chryseobacterium aquaeductus]
MKTLKLNLEVKNGTSIVGIVFKLFKKGNNKPLIEETKEGSFSHEFTDLEGEYNLYIIGSNPMSENRKTTIKLEGEGFTYDQTSDANPTTRTGKSYFVTYSFKTN